ncbi:MAG: hypothetical protein WC782_00925 [Methylococcaceae bacterium]|jgi:hypothetical protein
MYLPKDFIETAEGLIFAVVDYAEQDKVLCFLRYIKQNAGWKKLATESANAYLQQHYPGYLYHSNILDADLHALNPHQIVQHHQPQQRLQQLLHLSHPDSIQADLIRLCQLFQNQGIALSVLGVTGSLLVGLQTASSDIDLVCYERAVFQQCRELIQALMAKALLQPLSEPDWLEAYQRRACALSLDEYIWHEQRKFNKAMINGRKFDLSFVATSAQAQQTVYQKHGKIQLVCQVSDAAKAYDYPAEFSLSHPSIRTFVSFTATYTGQALAGETVELAGMLEENREGELRIVVGSSREADGEYIKVIQAHA